MLLVDQTEMSTRPAARLSRPPPGSGRHPRWTPSIACPPAWQRWKGCRHHLQRRRSPDSDKCVVNRGSAIGPQRRCAPSRSLPPDGGLRTVAGSTRTSSCRSRASLASDSTIAASSPPGRSVRPNEPAKSTSPANSSRCVGSYRQTDPSVCPGVCSTWNDRVPDLHAISLAQLALCGHAFDLEPVVVAAVQTIRVHRMDGQRAPVARSSGPLS